MALPQEFLRKPGWTPEGSGGVSAGSGDPQLAADAKLAMMLQVSFCRNARVLEESWVSYGRVKLKRLRWGGVSKIGYERVGQGMAGQEGGVR